MSKDDKQPAPPAADMGAVIAASPTTAGTQAQTAGVISGADRGPELPAESQLDQFMAELRAGYEKMKAELEQLKAQQASALAAGGTPLPARYAGAAADKAAALVAAHPDCPPDHFKPLLDAVGKLQEAAAAADGKGDPAAAADARAAIEKFAARTHARGWGKSIDFSALLDDAEAAAEHAAAA